MSYLKEIQYLLGDSINKVYLFTFLFIISSVLDVIGVGLVGPYVAIIIDPGSDLVISILRLFEPIGLTPTESELIIIAGLVLVAIFCAKSFFGVIINRAILQFSYKECERLRNDLMKNYQGQLYIDHCRRNSADYIYAIQTLCPQYAMGVLYSILRIAGESIVALFIIFFLAFIHGQLLFVLLSIIFIFGFLYDRLFKGKVARYGRRANNSLAKLIQVVNEGMEGVKEIRVSGVEDYFLKRLAFRTSAYTDAIVRAQTIMMSPRYILELILILFIVSMVYWCIYVGENLQLMLPIFSMFAVASMRLAPSANQIIGAITQIRRERHTVSTLYKDMSIEVPISPSATESHHKKEPFHSLVLEDVTFRYLDTSRLVLNGISFKINAGEVLGIMGPSGSGKSTLLNLMLGLLDTKSGDIFYNGRSLRTCKREWQSQVAYLPQTMFLIDATIKENIALGIPNKDIDDELLFESIKQAHLGQLVDDLPEGVDTVLGERGGRISGGQRQRVALARAFYKQRNFLILDESTSSLDAESEAKIIGEIERLKGSKTILVISHNIKTLQHCDRIYRIFNGKISLYSSPEY